MAGEELPEVELPDAALFFSARGALALEREVATRGGAKETVLIIEIKGCGEVVFPDARKPQWFH